MQTKTNFPQGFVDRLDLSRHATPKLLRGMPIHNWFVFPHSYSAGLVTELLDYWGLGIGARICDPFVGAGTTLLTAKSRGIEAVGWDISPLAVFVTNAKVASYQPQEIEHAWKRIQRRSTSLPLPREFDRSGILGKVLDLEAHKWLEHIHRNILVERDDSLRRFFSLALLRVLPEFSRVQSDGGWFRWRTDQLNGKVALSRFAATVTQMLSDLSTCGLNHNRDAWHAIQNDARTPVRGWGQFDALITSPPYPNRHDYTRIFTPQLLFQFLDDQGLKDLRYHNLRSHVEARPLRKLPDDFEAPRSVCSVLAELSTVKDKRIPRMVRGYFEDMYLTFLASKRVVKKGGHLAFVVGNVQHSGVHILVDELLAELGMQAGLKWQETWVIRLRGNSAQQMGRFGRTPSRESVVIFERV